MEFKLAMVILFLSVSSAFGQTPSDFEMKYGKPLMSYRVSENILMTPEYTTDGQVCLMRLYPRHFTGNTNHISPSLPFPELKTVLNQLVPIQTRGAKKEPFDTGAAGGGGEWMFYSYQKVEFYFVSSLQIDADSWKTRKEYVFSIEPSVAPAQPKREDSAPSDNDFDSSRVSSIELVNIRWNGRKCANQ